MPPALPQQAQAGQKIRLPGQSRVAPEEYREFLVLGHGGVFDLEVDKCGLGLPVPPVSEYMTASLLLENIAVHLRLTKKLTKCYNACSVHLQLTVFDAQTLHHVWPSTAWCKQNLGLFNGANVASVTRLVLRRFFNGQVLADMCIRVFMPSLAQHEG